MGVKTQHVTTHTFTCDLDGCFTTGEVSVPHYEDGAAFPQGWVGWVRNPIYDPDALSISPESVAYLAYCSTKCASDGMRELINTKYAYSAPSGTPNPLASL